MFRVPRKVYHAPGLNGIIRVMKWLILPELAKDLWGQLLDLKEQKFFRDKLSLSLLIPTMLLNIITLLIMVFRLKPTGFLVPVKYSSLAGFDALGPWYQAYVIAFFGLGVTTVNTILASESFSQSRITSFFMVVGAFVVALFCLIIGTAFAVIV